MDIITAIKDLAERSRLGAPERAYAFTRNLEFLFMKDGDSVSVTFSLFERTILRSNILLHSHPIMESYGVHLPSGLSLADLHFAYRYDLHSIHAIADNVVWSYWVPDSIPPFGGDSYDLDDVKHIDYHIALYNSRCAAIPGVTWLALSDL